MNLVRATVLLNLDPERKMRLQVLVLGQPGPQWAIPCLPAEIYTLPRVGSTVWLAYEAGNPDQPVWLGVLPTSAP